MVSTLYRGECGSVDIPASTGGEFEHAARASVTKVNLVVNMLTRAEVE